MRQVRQRDRITLEHVRCHVKDTGNRSSHTRKEGTRKSNSVNLDPAANSIDFDCCPVASSKDRDDGQAIVRNRNFTIRVFVKRLKLTIPFDDRSEKPEVRVDPLDLLSEKKINSSSASHPEVFTANSHLASKEAPAGRA